ncbi:MAG: hypothetical protein EBR54_07760, partial [Flavobacteriia bacterium]|nr:hypothetical protein [Flavobacteriia bacterium]
MFSFKSNKLICKLISMKLRINLLGLFIALFATSLVAQQDKLLTHFMYDKMSVNPGETGIDEGICATSIYR